MTAFGKMKEYLIRALSLAIAAIKKAVDIRDCFVFGGLGLLGYGLYLFHPWIAFTVCGAVLLAIGIFIGRSK